ncbi:MAG: UDP-N-acetylglucosamine--N-acetylmuramyl-(pentapeptide) pyrophosphoryl-undecaprenol N-acetylglucosamine transferase [Canibacter sp.]
MTTYLLAGGGTAGHVNPLLALVDEITERDPHASIIALGTVEGLESRLVPEHGTELVTIPKLPFPRRPSKYALTFPKLYIATVKRLRRLIRERNIDVVIGFGGYVSTPAYRAALKEKIPFVVHEANALPGLANKLGARNTPHVAVTFAGTPIANATVTGMPLRPEITGLDRRAARSAARKKFGLHPDKPVLLVTGGSLGARGINEGIAGSAQKLINSGAEVLHVWGGLTEVQDPGIDDYHVVTYCNEMDQAFAACDLVVSRAGATTVSELSGLGVPAIFSPYRSGNGEQSLNCKAVVEAGGALTVEDADITPGWVTSVLIPLLHDQRRLDEMSRLAKTVGTLTGTEQLFHMVERALNDTV